MKKQNKIRTPAALALLVLALGLSWGLSGCKTATNDTNTVFKYLDDGLGTINSDTSQALGEGGINVSKQNMLAVMQTSSDAALAPLIAQATPTITTFAGQTACSASAQQLKPFWSPAVAWPSIEENYVPIAVLAQADDSSPAATCLPVTAIGSWGLAASGGLKFTISYQFLNANSSFANTQRFVVQNEAGAWRLQPLK